MRMTEEERQYYERTRKPLIPSPKTRLGKIFFALGITLWFAILMLPCALFYMATVDEITFHHADVPRPDAHPMFRVQLIMEPDNRGFQITRSFIASSDANQQCLQTHVNYIFWQTNQSDTDAVFCDCYEQQTRQSLGTTMQPCPPQ